MDRRCGVPSLRGQSVATNEGLAAPLAPDPQVPDVRVQLRDPEAEGVVAVEMESSGVAAACHKAARTALDALAVAT